MRWSAFYFLIAFFLINFLSASLIISAIGFLGGGTISRWHFPMSVFLATILQFYIIKLYYLKDDLNAYFLKSSLSAAFIIIISVFIGGFFYDLSYDGQGYHQEAIYQMKSGWNPFQQELPVTVNQSLWSNHYGKGAEISQAVFYVFFKNIETGKATNLIVLIASFFLSLSFLYTFSTLTLFKRIIIAVLLACNPIVINQLLTYYVDGYMASLLLLLFLIFALIYQNKEHPYLFLLFSVIVILANVKFTSLIFLILLISGFVVILFIEKKKEHLKSVLLTSVLGGIVGVFIVGYNPYVTNTVKYNHPFYPIFGNKDVDIFTTNTPSGLGDKNRIEKLFISVFSHTDNIKPDGKKHPELKIPFSVNKTDIANAPKVDPRIGGFGPLFSGILVTGMLLLVVILFNKRNGQLLKYTSYIFALIIFSMSIISDPWWARYIPQFYFIPVVVLIMAEVISGNFLTNAFKYLLYISIVLNLSLCAISIPWNLIGSLKVHHQIEELKTSKEVLKIDLGSCASNRVRLYDQNIPFKTEEIVDGEKFSRSDTKFLLPSDVKDLQEPLILKLVQDLRSKELDESFVLKDSY